ncbi:DNA/RNA non-specific endonuclease [Algibacter lectus]|uniref:DNA/RNA non-specific endonuclease n=1 Tax=Algibacter lectus TaxID=221126 RepID=UPI0026EE4ADE|nr:DNA/RNA non-specific endonuclease [Algibacter lectus]MDO7138289.1 DNA/RNA non-specific endonuclease [Algibacter lectus]
MKKILLYLTVFIFALSCKKTIKRAAKNIPVQIISKQVFKEVKHLSSKNWDKLKDLGFALKTKKNSIEVFDDKGNLLGSIRGDQITSTPGFTTKTYNKLLDSKLFSNFKYKVENTIYQTDEKGRVISVFTSNFPRMIIKKPRNPLRQGLGNLPKGGIKGVDVGGHGIANRLGGISEVINMFPMNKKLNGNGGEWFKLEEFVENNRKYIKDFNIKFIYKDNSHRPDFFRATYIYKGEVVVKTFVNMKTI